MGRHLLRLFAAYALLYGGAVLVTVIGSSFVFEEQQGTAADFGYLEAAWSAGSVIGAAVLVRLTEIRSARLPGCSTRSGTRERETDCRSTPFPKYATI
ncbi:hypothetical protein [Mesorhizobium argentiipisi]|uniref:Uncharacterized protein n=1 Tax=Mesorhizobium argentiipisi TaxID=3015175 RepID=A0ABU8KL82_9HYPH